MMRVVDYLRVQAPAERVWSHAVAVEQWPVILPHYRWVTRREGAPGGDGVVEMSAWRPFGPLRWPTWWLSQMWVDAARREIRYRHIGGITKGMDVLWTVTPTSEGWTDVTIVHTWDGPDWSFLRRPASEWVIGPVFVHGIAARTLAGVARAARATP
ncbi:MAG: SRPBCC family protein [Gemmatimonadota bacterium]